MKTMTLLNEFHRLHTEYIKGSQSKKDRYNKAKQKNKPKKKKIKSQKKL